MTELPDYGTAMWQHGERAEFIFQDFPLRHLSKVAGWFSTATEARIESVDYIIQLALDPTAFDDVRLIAPAETRHRRRFVHDDVVDSRTRRSSRLRRLS